MATKKPKKPKEENPQNVDEDNIPEIDLESCESFDPSGDQFLTDEDSSEEDYDFGS